MGNEQNKVKKKHSAAMITMVASIVLVAVVTAVGFLILANSVTKKIIESNVDSMEELALHDARSIRNAISLRWDNMEGVAKELSNESFESISSLFGALKNKTPSIPSAIKTSLLSEDGTNYISNGVVEKNSYLDEICNGKTDRFVVRVNTNMHFRENVSEVIFLGVPTRFSVGGVRYEWLICQFPINTLEDELKISSYDDNGYSSVIDANGNYVINISRNHSFLTYDNFWDELDGAVFEGFSSVDEARTTTTTTGATSIVYTKDGQKNIMVITKFELTDWYFITTVPTSVFEKQSNAITSSFILLLVIIGAILLLILVLILRQRKQEAELRISNAASKSKTEFLFNMSHDIRTPMNAILGYTDIALNHREDPHRVEESLTKIKTASQHLLNLINDILEMSRIESGTLELNENPVDLRRLIDGVAQMSETLAVAKSIDFSAETGTITHPYLCADELHWNEVMINLISNAVKYTQEGGTVRFITNQIGDVSDGKITCRFEVIDNGIGMSDEFQRHIFEAFSRERTSTVSKQEGAGLGLSIVKRIVDLSGGTIRVKSKINEGSSFVVEAAFRVLNEEEIKKFEAENQLAKPDESAFSFENKKVLLVEDNEMNREIATEILSEAGLIVETAEDGEIAVRAVKNKGTNYYDFVLMDIQMPVMDGYAATKAIRDLPGGDLVTIIALSANAFEEDVQRSLSAGMNAHVAKPIDVKSLFETMQSLVGKEN